MARFFERNISFHGRMARGIIGAILLIVGVPIAGDVQWWIGLILVVAGLFAIFEAIRGWCLLRACGVRTKM